ncbi:hypothetical protein [uncultured Hydrogenophaga sp.]|uniref:hypothetical protein n=1 Tax=uncultured Hydrogenophaga sp. TaxID=199683 RepID=UPI00265DFB39|nr:hypothetical protein [uncultured Hydrogenophaga sp.]
MTTRQVLGHIDCPTCGTAGGVRITHDKNGEPFGYCEAKCHQQIRIGGDSYRVGLFLQRYPWAASKPEPAAPAVAPVSKPAAPAAKAATTTPAAAPAPSKPARRSPMEDALGFLGMK